jgi:hypothetical protein
MTMASSDRSPRGLRRTDPDETEGRLLYRQLADGLARFQIAYGSREKRLKSRSE